MISVCMATYNGERFLPRQLETILPQLALEDELVVSDDSSSDRTLTIVRDCADPRIRTFPGNTFHSPIFNFEHALRQARGDTLVLADQDDVWLPDKLGVVRDRFARRPPGPYLIALDAYVADESERVLHESLFEKLGAGPGFFKNIYANRYVGACLAFSRELLEIALPFPRNIPMHDMWLGQLGELVGTTEFVPEKTILYRRHGANLTDFRIRFRPWTQVKRRAVLTYCLLARTASARRGRLSQPSG
jgi:glycosyltransferase involved in cell wall biosynthesis